MNDVLPMIEQWRARGERVALATVVRTLGSAPRGVGSKMAVSESGAVAGSVSGGCIEGAVFEACQEALGGAAARLLHFGVADDDAWEVGLACGGTIDVLVEPLDAPLHEALRAALAAERPVALATAVGGSAAGAKLLLREDGSGLGALEPPALQAAVARDALAMLARAESGLRGYPQAAGDQQVFIETYPAPPTMFIIGAVHIAISLVTFAKALGFRTVVVDARGVFATPERFAHADELILAWPDEVLEGRLNGSSYVVLLTHDPKLDDPALKLALASPARYVGALGSPKTHARRLARLREEGFPEEALGRIHGPVGLPLGARTPEEIAVSIIAEIVAVRHGQRAGLAAPSGS